MGFLWASPWRSDKVSFDAPVYMYMYLLIFFPQINLYFVTDLWSFRHVNLQTSLETVIDEMGKASSNVRPHDQVIYFISYFLVTIVT